MIYISVTLCRADNYRASRLKYDTGTLYEIKFCTLAKVSISGTPCIVSCDVQISNTSAHLNIC